MLFQLNLGGTLMSNTNEAFKEQFIARRNTLKLFEEFLINKLKTLETLSTDFSDLIEQIMSELFQHEETSEEFREAKQIANSFLNDDLPFTVALARLNYLYDVTCFKIYHMESIKDIFDCYF